MLSLYSSDLCAIVFYNKRIRGRLHPKVARTGPFAFAQEVCRVKGQAVTKYLGIVKLPEKADVIETGEESNDHNPERPEQVQQKLQ